MKFVIMLLPVLMIGGCTLAKVDVQVVSERTALENQILGSYKALDQDMLLVASVRGVDSEGKIREAPRRSREKQDALAAMQVLDFYADDLQLFKEKGWVGETNRGMIQPFEEVFREGAERRDAYSRRFSKEEFLSIITEINQSRQVVMQQVINMNYKLSPDDMPEVERAFARLHAENARSGEKIQGEDGAWREK